MATEAEIIPEPIPIGKTEEESRHLTKELCDKAVEFLPGDLKKFRGGFNQPAETDECVAKEENMQVASDTMNTVSEGNPEVSEGESFLISPEAAKVASKETSGMSEHSEVDDIPFKAEKIPEDEKQKAGTGENEVKATEDIVEKYDTDHDILNLEGTSLKAEKLEELNLAIGGEKRVEEVVVIADQGSSLEEKCGSIEDERSYSQERENEGTRAHENDDVESNKQVLSMPEANLQLKKQASIDTPDPVIDSLKKVNETVTEASNSNLVQEELEEKSCKEVKDTEPEKLPALVKKEKGIEAIEPIETSGTEKDQIISESIGGNLPSTVAESSEIKDHVTTSEISEGVERELPNTYEEVACEHKAAPEGDDKLEEVSGTIIKDQSQATIESSDEIKYISGDNDSIQDKNMLDTSSVMKPEELCLQDVDNRDFCSIGSRTENIVEKSPTEEGGQSEINEITDKDSGTSMDISKDYSNSESEKVGADMKVVQATEKELAMTEASDEMKKDEECTVPAPEGNIREVENINVVQQSQEGKLEKEEILKESFQKQNEPEREKTACPLNAVYEDVNTAISSENAETSTSIKEATSMKDHDERFEGDGMEDTPTNADAISENGESKEKDHLQIKVNVNTESVEVEIPNKNADDLHVADPLVGESAEKGDNNQYEFSDIQPEDQVHEENRASEEMDKHIKDVSEACQSRKSTNSENIFTEEATTADLESETGEMDKEKVKEVYLWDPEKCSETNEALENKQEGIQEEEEACNAEKPEIETRGDIAESGLTGGCTSDTIITSSFVRDETTPELIAENKSYKEEDADERSNMKEEDHDEPKMIKIGDDNDEQTAKDDPMVPSPKLIEEETIESSKDEANKVEKLEEENSKDWITEDGKSKDLSSDSITEAPIQNLQDYEERAEEFEKSEKAVGESTGDETNQPAESPQEMLSNSMMKQEEDLQCENKNLNPTKAFPEEKRDEDRSYVIQAEESSRNIEQDDATESNEKKPSIAEEDFEQISTENEPQEMLEKSLYITSEETETNSSKADEIASLMEEATVQSKEETTENEEKAKGETDDSSTNDNGIVKEDHGLDDGTSGACKNTGSIVLETETKVAEMEVETITKGYQLDSKEKPEPKDAVENIEDNLKQKETEEVFEGPKSTIKEECAVIDDSPASTEEEMSQSFQKDEKEETPEIEVCKQSETAASGTGRENSDMEEQRIADTSNSLISDETVKESIKEDESSPMKLTKEEEDYSSVSTECLKEADSEEQIEAKHSEVEAHSTKDREASLIIEESEERGQDEESRDPVSVHGEERESEEKIKEDVTDESKLCQDGSNREAVPEVRGETSLNKTVVDEELLSTVKEESAIIDDSPKSTEEEMYKSFQKDEKEETPEVEVCEKLETNNTVEDAEKQILEEEDTNKDQPSQLTEMMEENAVAIMSIKDVCKQSETAGSGTGREKSDIEEHPIFDISNSSINDETVKESIREDESSPMKLTKEASASNIGETDSTEETILQIIKETAEPNDDPILFDILKESNEEITTTEIKEDLVCSSSFEPAESKKSTEEETSVEGSIDTVDLDSAVPAAGTEETDTKEAEAEEKKHEINNVLAVEKNGPETTEHEGVGTDSADIDVKPADSSISCEKDKEIPEEEEDKVPNEGSEDQMEMTAREIPLKKILGDALKDHSTMPSEEHEPEPIEERKLTHETPEKDQAPYEHSESPVSEATDEKLMQMENNPTLDAPKVESRDTGEESGHEVKENLADEPHVHAEQETGKCITVLEAIDVSKGEEPREPEFQHDACESKTSQNEQSSDFGLEREKTHDGKPLDEVRNLEETSSTCKDGEKAIQEEENLAENLAKPESLNEDIEVEKEETELLQRSCDQMPEIVSMKDTAKNVEPALAGSKERPKSDSEPVAEDQSKETFPETSKSQADETTTNVQNQEAEKQIKEEEEDKLEDEDYINREQNANEVSKAVILSEEVDKEVEKAVDSEGSKEHVEEESSTSELHLVPKGNETTNEVEDYSSVSTERLKEADSEEQIEATHSEVEAHSTKDREASLIIEESEERGQDEESRDPVSVHGEERESEEKIKEDITDESKLCKDGSNRKAVTEVKGETSLNKTEVDEELLSTVKEERAIIDDSPKSTEEEMYKSFQKDEKEETPEVEVCEKLETNNTVEDAEKQILEVEDTNKDQPTQLTEMMEENAVAIMSIKDVCKQSETAGSGTGREKSDIEEHPIADNSNSSINDETVKESIREDESSPMKLTKEASASNIGETDSTEETTLQIIKETAEPNNDPILFDILKESNEEITPTEIKEDLVCSSSFEPAESKKNTEEETSVEGSINTVDLDSAVPAAGTEETDTKEAEAEEKKHEIDNVLAVEKNGPETTEHEWVGTDSADIDVKPADSSISCEKDKEIPEEEEDKVPNEGSEDQMEMTAREIPLKEILGDALKDHSTMPSEEHEPEPIEERKLTDETSEKDQAPYEHSESPVSEATDEKLMQMENNPTLDVPKVESQDTGKESGHEVKENLADEPHVHAEQETGKCITVLEAIDVSKGEEPREPEFQHDACESKTSQNEQSSDFGLEREKTHDGKPLDEVRNLEETSSTCKDGEKAIQEEENLAENLAKPESLKEDIEVEKEETELLQRSCDQMPEIVSMNDTAKNVEPALAGSKERPKSDSEPVAEDQSKETFPETSKSQADETTTDVQNQEAEKQKKEEDEDKLEDEDYINKENANEVSKAVILSEEVDKEVEKAVDSEGSKEHVEEESSTSELHPVPKGDETTNEVISEEDYSSVSTECLKEADSEEQIEAKHSEVEAHSTKDREASLIIEESEERGQDEESRDPVSVHGEERESEEKIKEDVTDESKLCQDGSNREAVTEVSGETSLNKTEVDEELLSTVKEESAIIDDSPKSTEEEMYKSFQKDEKEETPEVEVCEKLETNNTVEDAEKQILEVEDTNKDQPTQLTEMMEENAVAIMSIKDVCKQSETAGSGTGREKSDIEEHPIADNSNSSINDETVKESIREDESSPMKLTKEASASNIGETDSTEETTLQIIKETAEPNNDPILFDILKESNEEIKPTEIKEDLVCSSSFEPAESKKNTEEETSVEGSINTVDLDSALPVAGTEETDMKEAEAEEKKHEMDNVLAVEKNGPETTEHEGVGTDSADIDVKPADSSISSEKDKEIPQEEEDKVPNEGSEDQMEMTAREIPLKEILGDALKDYSTVPSEEHEPEPIEERKLTDETSEKDQAPFELSEAPVSDATDEKLMQMENNPTLDTPKVEFEDNGKGSGHEVKEDLAEEPYVHTEEETGKCNTVSEATDVSKGEEPREPENQRDACESKTSQNEQSSDFGLERKETDDGKPLDEASNLEETSGTCEDGEKAIQEENLAENLAKSESSKEDIAVEKEETEQLRRAHDQMPEADSVNDNAKNVELAPAGFEEKPKSDSEPMAEGQSKETFPESSKSQADETTTDVQNPETEKQIKEEVEDKLEHEEYINREQNAIEVSKTVILSEEVDKEVDKADDNKDIKEHVMEEESSTNELHPVPKGDETTNEVEDYSSVSTECLEEADSEEQIEGKHPEVEAHSTKDRETSLIIEESEEKGQDEESRDPVSVHREERESEEGIEEDIDDESKLCQDENDSKAVTKVRGETSLNNTEVDEELANTSNASSGKMSLQTTESDANQETKEVENVQLEEISSGLARQIPSNDNDEVQKQGINVDIVDKDEAEVNERDSDAVHMSKDQIDEADKSLTVEKVDQLPSSDHELVQTKSETSKTSNAGEPGKTELASDENHVSEDKGTEEDAETKKSLTAEEQDENEVEETKEVPETSSDCISQRVETIVEDDISSHNTLPKEKPEEQLQTSVSTLPSGDEENSTAHPIEKIGEEIQTDAEIVKHETLEDSSDTKTTEEVCLQKEEHREPSTVSEEETIVDRGLQKEEPKEQLQTTSSTLPSEERGHGTGALSEEIEYDKAKEEVPIELDVFSGDESEQNLSANKPEKGTTSSELLPKEQEEEAISTVEKIEEEKIKEAEIPENKISEDSSDAKKTIETCLEKEEFQELEDAKKDDSTARPIEKIKEEIQTDAEIVKHETLEDSSDTKTTEEVCLQKEEQREPSAVSEEETIVDRGLQKEEPKEQIQTTSSTLPSEERGHGTGALSEEIEYDKAKEEVPIELDVFSGDESEQNLSAIKPEEGTTSSELLPKEQEEEAISTVEKIEEEKIKEAEIQENKISEDSSDAKKTIETCPKKEEFQELEDAKKDDSTAHPIEKIEEEIQKDAEIVKHETLEDSSDTKTTEEVCLQKEEQREPSTVLEEETIVDQGQKEEPEEQIQNKSSTLPSEEREHGTGAISEEIEYDKSKEDVRTELDVFSGDKSEQNLSANKSEEGTTSSELLPKEQKEEVISMVEKIEDEKIKEAEIPENKILEDSSDAKKTIEMCLEKEEFQELEDAKKDETAAAQALQVEEPKEQSLTSSSKLPSEDLKHGNTTRVDEIEEEKVKEVATLEKERPQEPEAVLDQELTIAQVSIAEESLEIETMSTIQYLDEEKTKEDEKLNENSGDSSAVETEEICLQKEEPSELQVFPKEEITSGQTFSEEQSDEQLHISTSAITSEELKHETKKAEDEKTNEEEIIKDKSPVYASDARTTEEVCSQKERSIELEAVVEDEKTADHTLTEKILEEQVQNPTSALPSKEEGRGSTSTTEKIGSEKTEESEFLQDDNGEHECLRKEQLQKDEAIAKNDGASAHTIPTEKSEEQISGPFVALPSKEHKHETVDEVDKPEEEKVKEEEMQNEDSDEAKTVQEICPKKDEKRDPRAVLEGETIATQVIAEESQEQGTLREEKKIKEAETLEDDKSPQSECARELQSALEDEDTAAKTLPGEKQADQLHITNSTLPSEEQEDETREPELQEDESPEKTPEQTREIEEASNVKMETHEKAYDNELLTETKGAAIEEKLVKARDETRDEENQCEKTNEGNEIILNEVSKEEIIEDKEVIETSHSTSLSEGLTKDGCGVDELKAEPVEDKTNEAFKTTTCQNEELVVEAQKSSENEIIEKHTVCEDKTVEDPGQASVARIETATVMEEESSIELAQAEGTKDLAEGNEIIDDIQQPEETANIASDKQIPRVFYPIEITEITGSIGKEDVPIDLQDRVAESSQKAEVGDVKEIYPKVEEVEHGGDKTTDNLIEEITKDSMSVEDLTKVSTSDPVESSTKKTLQVTAQDMIDEREEKDETGATQILVDKPEESPAPSSKFPCEEEEHGVTTKVDAVKEEELKEVETPDNDSSDTNTGGGICFEKEEIKGLRAVMEQETVTVQAPPTELKDKELAETPVSKLEDVHKEDEIKEEDIRDKTKETLIAPAYAIQNEELSMETKTDSAKNNFEKEIVAEDKTVKDLEQASVGMEEATTAREEIRGEADPVESTRTTSSIGKDHFPIEQQDRALETSEKAEVGDLETGNAQEICSEAGVDHEAEKRTDNSGVGITQEPASPDSPNISLSDPLQRSTREKMQVAKDVIEKRELIGSKEEPKEEEAEAIQLKEAKADEKKDEGEEGDEHNKADSGSDAPVMVEAPRDPDIKPHKKSHNILSGVGSKVKHSISKVKKAIIGKSSHSKDPKPISPKGSEK